MIEVEVLGAVARLRLSRPEVRNALTPELFRSLADHVRRLGADSQVRAIILTGSGSAFCSGADLAAGASGAETPDIEAAMRENVTPLIKHIAECPKPVIAAVNGTATGGGVGLALAADIVLAARSASFICPFGPRLGLVPDAGSSWFLPRLVGHSRALGIVLLGDRISAEQAEAWGLIWQCVDDALLEETALSIAQRLAAGPTRSFAMLKQLMRSSYEHGLPEQLSLEAELQAKALGTDDAAEGIRAFLEKRAPKFSGR